MSPTRKLFANAAIAVGSSTALLLGMTGTANADPASPLPIDATQAPGLSAVQGLSPAIQKAAADPYNAVSTLMAAAAAFTGNAAAPGDSKNVASAVNSFVAQPAAAHVPAPGALPAAEAHLPAGVDPADPPQVRRRRLGQNLVEDGVRRKGRARVDHPVGRGQRDVVVLVDLDRVAERFAVRLGGRTRGDSAARRTQRRVDEG